MRHRLVDEARSWWKLWSVRLAGIFAGCMAALVANPAPVLQFLQSVPERWKPLVPLATLVITFVVPTMVRLWRQPISDKEFDQ